MQVLWDRGPRKGSFPSIRNVHHQVSLTRGSPFPEFLGCSPFPSQAVCLTEAGPPGPPAQSPSPHRALTPPSLQEAHLDLAKEKLSISFHLTGCRQKNILCFLFNLKFKKKKSRGKKSMAHTSKGFLVHEWIPVSCPLALNKHWLN